MMKRYIALLLCLLFLASGSILAVAATDEATAEVTESDTEFISEAEAEVEYTLPAVAEAVTGKPDGAEGGKGKYATELWEAAQEWVINNLSTVVGGVLALFTLIMGFVTKFSFVPKILTAFSTLLNAVGTWHKSSVAAQTESRTAFDNFAGTIIPIVDHVSRQSDENIELRRELVELRKEHIKVVKEYRGLTAALLKATEIQNYQLEDVFQISPLTLNDKDKHREAFMKKMQIVEALAKKAEAGGGESGEE